MWKACTGMGRSSWTRRLCLEESRPLDGETGGDVQRDEGGEYGAPHFSHARSLQLVCSLSKTRDAAEWSDTMDRAASQCSKRARGKDVNILSNQISTIDGPGSRRKSSASASAFTFRLSRPRSICHRDCVRGRRGREDRRCGGPKQRAGGRF